MNGEEFQIDIADGRCEAPRRLRSPEECGLTWGGEPEAINRLALGFSGRLPAVLEKALAFDRNRMESLMAELQSALSAPLVIPSMPIQDAIDLAEFLVETTIRFSRFTPGAATVGGPIEVAAITKHEGFRWVRRKHYYDAELNREESR